MAWMHRQFGKARRVDTSLQHLGEGKPALFSSISSDVAAFPKRLGRHQMLLAAPHQIEPSKRISRMSRKVLAEVSRWLDAPKEWPSRQSFCHARAQRAEPQLRTQGTIWTSFGIDTTREQICHSFEVSGTEALRFPNWQIVYCPGYIEEHNCDWHQERVAKNEGMGGYCMLSTLFTGLPVSFSRLLAASHVCANRQGKARHCDGKPSHRVKS